MKVIEHLKTFKTDTNPYLHKGDNMLENAQDKKEFLSYCAEHLVLNGSSIEMNGCHIGLANNISDRNGYHLGWGIYTNSSLPRLLFRYDILKVESYKDFIKNGELSTVACIGFSESKQGWLGWSHRACFFFTIGYVVEEGSLCTETGWLDDYAKQHPEKCFNLPAGFTCKTLDDCRRCAIAYAMAVA